MSETKLTYFAGRGRAEPIRLSLAAAGIEWKEDIISEPNQVAKLRQDGLLIFGQLPLLEIDGLKLVQSMSIVRYLADKHGFMGKTPEENVRIAMLTDGARDWLTGGIAGIMFMPPEKRDEKRTACLAKSKSRYLPAFEKALQENGSNGYLVGDKLSMADIALLDVLIWVWEMDENLVKEFPGVKMFHDKITSVPRIQAYLKGPQRYPPPDEKYVQTVTHALQ